MTPASVFPYTVLFAMSYLVAPTMLVWGWLRWIKHRPRLWTILPALSFIGFILASASAVFALGVILYAEGAGFEHAGNGVSLLYRCVRQGAVLSLLGVACSIGGVWRRGPLRWQAPLSAAGTLAFWLLATAWP
jgi:hypothetical protein